jgi:hypothetical protein
MTPVCGKARQYRSYPNYVKDPSQDVAGQIKSHLQGEEYVRSFCCDNDWCIANDADFFDICGDLYPTICSFHRSTKLEQETVLSDWRVDETRYGLKNDIVDGHPMQMCATRLRRSLGLGRGECDMTESVARCNAIEPIRNEMSWHLPYFKSNSDKEGELPIFQALRNYLTVRSDQDDDMQRLLQGYYGKSWKLHKDEGSE